MSIQSLSALITVVIVLIIVMVFLRVRMLAGDRKDYTPVLHNAYGIRAALFAFMVIIGLPISIWLLSDNPYSASAEAAQVVNVTGGQWYWDLDHDTATTGTPVEFRVTSIDVNHGFGIYDEAGEIVAQTQAMPGYVNRLTHVFDRPGAYQIMCLEYCGLAHHDMILEFDVTDATALAGADTNLSPDSGTDRVTGPDSGSNAESGHG